MFSIQFMLMKLMCMIPVLIQVNVTALQKNEMNCNQILLVDKNVSHFQNFSEQFHDFIINLWKSYGNFFRKPVVLKVERLIQFFKMAESNNKF